MRLTTFFLWTRKVLPFFRIRNPKKIETIFSIVRSAKESQRKIKNIVQEVLESYNPEIFFAEQMSYKHKTLEASFLYLHTRINFKFFFEEGEKIFEEKISNAWSINIKIGIDHDGDYNKFKYPFLRCLEKKITGVKTENKVYRALGQISKTSDYSFKTNNSLDDMGIDFLIYKKINDTDREFIALQVKSSKSFSKEIELSKKRNVTNPFYPLLKKIPLSFVVIPHTWGLNQTQKKIKAILQSFEKNHV